MKLISSLAKMPQDQHYIPAFYLRRWVDKKDGKLCVYSRPYDCVKAYRKHPEASGYEEDLYAIHGAGDETANHLEGPIPRLTRTTRTRPQSITWRKPRFWLCKR